MTEHRFLTRIAELDLALPYGEVRQVMPGRIEASGPMATVGALWRACDRCAGPADRWR